MELLNPPLRDCMNLKIVIRIADVPSAILVGR